ncbi:MAG TPA: permease-like cell division protein FtsX [Actinomycetota bacterium]
MHDLDTRLERLAAEATPDAVAPEVAAIARRGRRRRRRQLAGTALVVVAVAAAGLVLPARLTGRPAADRPLPATDVTGAASIGGYWFGKADPSVMPESFRVRLAAPGDYKRLQRALCVRPPIKPLGVAPCMDGVDAVVETRALLEPMLVAKPWLATSDVSVFPPPGTTDIQRKAVRTRLEAIDGVAKVTYESPQAAFRRLPEKVRKVAKDSASPISMRASFRVALDQPNRVAEFHLALCGSRKTGECAGGLVVFEHPRKR